MKTNKLFLGITAMMAAVLSVSSCSSDEPEKEPQPEKARTISFTSTISDGTSSTRATSEYQTITVASSVGVFGIQNSSLVTGGNNNQHTVSSGNLSSTTQITCTDGEANFYAYAPYQEGWTYNDANSFSIATDQSTEAGYLASDLLYGVPTANNPVTISESTTSIPLTFTHKLARLVITIKKAIGVTKALNGATVSIAGTKIGTTLNPSTGALGSETGSVTPIKVATLSADIAAGEEASTTVYAVIVPQQVASTTDFIKITKADNNAGDNNNYSLAAKLAENTTFESGKTYSLTVIAGTAVVTARQISVSNESTALNGWTGTDALTEQNATDPSGSELVASLSTGSNNNWKYYATETTEDNVTYPANTFRWIASNNNLMPLFTFSNGELASYSRLVITIGSLTTNKPRLGYYIGSDFTALSSTFGSEGTKKYDLTSLGIDLTTVTSIVIGGNGDSGTCTITDIKLIP